MTTDAPRSDVTALQKRYYSVKETASMLGVNIKTIYRAIAAGELPARRIRSTLRIPRYAVLTDGDAAHNADCDRVPARATVQGYGRVASPEE